jgi:DNA-binding transcriptional LysR family regulator
MKLLEDEIGLPLFIRHRRGMHLTVEGEELRRRLTGPLRQIEQAVEETRALADETARSLAFGMPPTVSYVLAGRLARRAAAQAPNMKLRIVEGYAGHLVDWLQRGEIDAAILYGPGVDFHMSVDELLIEELMMVGPGDSALDPSQPVEFSAFATKPLVLPSRPHGLRMIVESAAAKAGVQLDVRFEADSFLVMKELVQYGLGYTVLPRSAMEDEFKAGSLRFAPLANPRVARQLILGTQNADRSRAAEMVGRLVREEITELVRSGQWSVFLQFDDAATKSTSNKA